MKTNAIATINNVAIVVIDEKEKMVPIRPICDILGIDSKAQRDRIERDEILKSVGVMMTSTGADGKEYEMLCIPFKFVFGWLFSIDTLRVNAEAKESVIRYKLECYDALYNYFTEPNTFLAQKQILIDNKMRKYDSAKDGFKNAKYIMDDARKEFDLVRHYTIDEWRANSHQFVLSFTELEEGGVVL
ncbi:MAG: phage antirepressor N-terminal domain-containing protein [Bacteroidales bacterium]